MSRILIVDDEPALRRLLAVALRADGHEIAEAGTVAQARAALAARQFDLVITDQKLPDGDGLGLLAACREADATAPVIFITAYATVDLAVRAMRQGAFDVLPKPFEPDAVRVAVKRACERSTLLRENESLRGAMRRLDPFTRLVGDSPPMQALREVIARVAPTAATVLITGETGTGKELVARAIHAASPRADRPFVAINCGAFTDTLLESELFGHERGAFTGADRARQGVFEAAHGGTLFLDEAGEMSPPLQAKLLRVLMDGEIVRIGSTTARRVDVRILVATHRDLGQRVQEGLFREDLYYRLAVVPIAVAPLRERAGDLPALITELLAQVAGELKVPPRRLCPAAVARLAGYPFPGNVRELRNLLERASILARGEEICPDDIPVLAGADARPRDWTAAVPTDLALRPALEELERALITRALAAADGVQAEAARRLGISRSDLNYKLRRHGPTEPHGG
ncbi:MAG: sigma-54-dependent transcriptional regulator [Candidatus Krumholzibacteriia bacterium]